MKTGSDPLLKADSEYPDWLWTVRLERAAPPIEDYDPDTKQYWQRLRRIQTLRDKQMMKIKRKFKIFS